MEDFVSRLIRNTPPFIGSQTLVPGPSPVPTARKPKIQLRPGPSSVASTFNQSESQHLGPLHTQLPPINYLNRVESTPARSVLRSDTEMFAWLQSQNSCNTQAESQMHSMGLNSSMYEHESPRIPKPYNEMTKADCAGVVANSIRSIILHTCNDEFRGKCFEKLKVNSSREAGRVIRERLIAQLSVSVEDESEPDQNMNDSVSANLMS